MAGVVPGAVRTIRQRERWFVLGLVNLTESSYFKDGNNTFGVGGKVVVCSKYML